ncbi:MAG: glycosyltransferase [Acidimicrobiia bacterium]
MIADRVPRAGFRAGDRRLADLLVGLTQASPDLAITLLAVDAGGTDEQRSLWRSLGIEVVTPPRDWQLWFDRRTGEFSAVVVHGRSVARRFDDALRRTQPQARLVVDGSMLGHRDRRHLERVLEGRDLLGADIARRSRLDYERPVLDMADAVLCRSPGEIGVVERMGGASRVFLLPGVVAPRAGSPGFTERSGIVVLGSFVDGLSSPDEDALLFLASEVLPTMWRLDPSIRVSVLGEDHPPELGNLDGIDVVGPGRDPFEVLDSASLVVIANRFGVGGLGALHLALEATVPFVATPLTASEFGLEGLVASTDDPRELAHDVIRLCRDESSWHAAREAGAAIADRFFGSAGHLRQLRELLATLGIVPRDPRVIADGPDRADVLPAWGGGSRRWRPDPGLARGLDPVRLRMPDVVQTDGLHRTTGGARPVRSGSYDDWRRARVCTREQRRAMQDEIGSFAHVPLVSVVVPTFNTDPDLLAAAIGSVQDQVYEHWELSIADDGSTNAATLEVLEGCAGNPKVKILRLPVNGGIVAASNAALEQSSGEFVALLDHDDVLDPRALFEVVRLLNQCPELDFVYTDEDKLDEDGHYCNPAFKPAWSPDLLRSVNYVTHLAVYRRALVDKLGGFRPGYDGSQDYDLALRVVDVTDRIGHVAMPLYSWRMLEGSTSLQTGAKPYAISAAREALQDSLLRNGRRGTVETLCETGSYRVRYSVPSGQKVAIIIPTRDRVELLRTCVESIQSRSTYRSFEIVVVDNGTTDPETLEFLALLDGRVLRYPGPFNFARLNNFAADQVEADHLLFLNNDVEVINGDWLESMLEHSQRPEVGAVGARLYFPSGAAQHEGVFIGYGGGAGNVEFGGAEHRQSGVHFAGVTGDVVRNFAAVTAACVMIRPPVFWDVGGFEERLQVAFNDVDLSLKIRQRGYEVVYTPFAELFHYESASRGSRHPMTDDAFLRRRWDITDDYHDPYYGPNYHNRHAFALEP